MHKTAFSLAAVVLLTAQVQRAHALVIRPPSLAERVAPADAVVVGKVATIEEKTVTAATATPSGSTTIHGTPRPATCSSARLPGISPCRALGERGR